VILKTTVTSKLLAIYSKKEKVNQWQIPQLLTDFPRESKTQYQGGCHILKLPPELISKLKRLSQEAEVSLSVLLLTAFKTLLYRYTYQQIFSVGVPIFNNSLSETSIESDHINQILVVNTDFSGNPTFRELLSRISQFDFPIEKSQKELLNNNHQPLPHLFQMSFTTQDIQVLSPEWLDYPFNFLELDFVNQFVSCDLSLCIQELQEEPLCKWDYNSNLFLATTIERLSQNYIQLLKSIINNPDQAISKLDLLADNEKHQLLVEWNQTKVEYPRVCVNELVEKQVEKTPNAIAVIYQTQQLTYQQLNQRGNQLAHYLKTLGVNSQDPVGICVERSLEMVIAILAVLKVGGICVPLDPSYPEDRLAYMLSDSQSQIIITTKALLNETSLANIFVNNQLIELDSEWEKITQQKDSNLLNQVNLDHLAYIIYTSGSTGKPKGVMMKHKGLTNLIFWHKNHRIIPSRTLQFAPISFDIAFHEIFSTCCTGGTLILITSEQRQDPISLLKLIEKHQIEKLYLPFVALQQLAEAIKQTTIPTSIREIMTAGEQLKITPQLANFFQKTGAVLHNHYGSSECQDVTTFTLTGEVDSWQMLPLIGRPLNNISIYLLDDHLQLVPICVVGKLYIGGDGLAEGYLNRPDLNQEKFISNPFGEGYIYQTGDLACYQEDGNLQCLGRVDRQVKIRGFRIELGEIEGLLVKHPYVKESVVILQEAIQGDKRLVSYIVLVENINIEEQKSVLTTYLRQNLPEYMIPSGIIILEKIPLTPTGKIDHRALPIPNQFDRYLKEELVLPTSKTEQLIAQIWQEVLRLEKVGIQDNFFELGGNSLLLISIQQKISTVLSINLSIISLFQYPTIQTLTRHLTKLNEKKGNVQSANNYYGEYESLLQKQRQLRHQHRKTVV